MKLFLFYRIKKLLIVKKYCSKVELACVHGYKPKRMLFQIYAIVDHKQAVQTLFVNAHYWPVNKSYT